MPGWEPMCRAALPRDPIAADSTLSRPTTKIFRRPLSERRSPLRPWSEAPNCRGAAGQEERDMGTEASRTADETMIRSLLEDRAQALRAKDADGVLAQHAPDFVQFSLAPPLRSMA